MTTILVVDDERDIRELLAETLLDANFQVIEAANGGSALERAAGDRPDIMLLDIAMPGMDGYEVLRRLKKNPDTQDLPVILLTALPASEGEQMGMELGVSHYINKPWEPGVVEAVVRVVLAEAAKPEEKPIDDGMIDVNIKDISDAGMGADTLVPTVRDPQIPSGQMVMTRLRRIRIDKSGPGFQKPQVIKTGERLTILERAMGGGIDVGSVVLAVGSAFSGKSVLCQHLIFGALEEGYGSAMFCSEHSPDSLAIQMESLGLDISSYVRREKLGLYAVPEATQAEDAEHLLAELSQSIEQLPFETKFIAIDSITDLVGSCRPQAVIGFFTNCRRLGNMGRTIFVVIDSYAFGAEMYTRLRSLCDGYFTLGSARMRGKQLHTIEVNKVNAMDLPGATPLCFEVEPGFGIRMVPISKVKI